MHLRRTLPGWIAAVLLLCLATGLALLMEARRGAFRDDFGAGSDDPAHFVTSLLVRDYLVHGFGRNPMAFAKDSYRHRPKIAIGHWPPLYYAAAGAWMTAAGTGRASLLRFQALLVGLASLAIWAACRRRAGELPATAAALALPLLPRAAIAYATVMLEAANSLLFFLALLALDRLLANGRWKDGLLFGLAASAAALTRIDSLALLPAALAAALCAGAVAVWKRPAFWLSFAVVLGLALPFYAVFQRAMWDGSVGATLDAGRILASLRSYLGFFPEWMTWPVLVLAACGAWAGLRRPANEPARRRAAVLVAGIGCGILLQAVAPGTVEPRRLFLAALPTLALAAEGAAVLAGPSRLARVALAAAVLAPAGWGAWRMGANDCAAFGRLAAWLQADPATRSVPVVLVASDGTGEGRLIASVAAREDGPARWVARASKLFSESNWSGSNHRLKISGPEAVLEAVERMPAAIVVVHSETDSREEYPEYGLVRDAMRGPPPGWKLAYEDRHRCNRHGPELLRVFVNPSLAGRPLREPPGGPDRNLP